MSGILRGKWYKVVSVEGNEPVAEQDDKPINVCTRYYDKEGNHLLTGVKFEAENVPPQAIRALSQALELAELAPCLIFGPHVTHVKFEELSDVDSRRLDDEYERRRRERDEAAAALRQGG